MPVFFAIVIVVAALATVLYPLVQRMRASQRLGEAATPQAQELLDRREELLGAMAELEYDRKLGNVNDLEHRRMRADYEAQAIDVLRRLDRLAIGIGEVIDREVAKARAQQAVAIDEMPLPEPAPKAVGRQA